jgi:Mn2+/Fe2+ NRAMP family transporter
MGVALLLNFIGIPPMYFLFLAAVFNGLSAPALMAIVWWLARSKKLLGGWASGPISQIVLAVATLAMAALPFFWLAAKN